MFQKFNTDTLASKFIKNLVSTVYTPTVQVWKPGKSLIKDFTYITKDYIVKANRDLSDIDIEKYNKIILNEPLSEDLDINLSFNIGINSYIVDGSIINGQTYLLNEPGDFKIPNKSDGFYLNKDSIIGKNSKLVRNSFYITNFTNKYNINFKKQYEQTYQQTFSGTDLATWQLFVYSGKLLQYSNIAIISETGEVEYMKLPYSLNIKSDINIDDIYGSVATFDDLPTAASEGCIYFIEDTISYYKYLNNNWTKCNIKYEKDDGTSFEHNIDIWQSNFLSYEFLECLKKDSTDYFKQFIYKCLNSPSDFTVVDTDTIVEKAFLYNSSVLAKESHITSNSGYNVYHSLVWDYFNTNFYPQYPWTPWLTTSVINVDSAILKAGSIIKSADIDLPTSIYSKKYFTILEPYVEGKFYSGLTSIYKSNTSVYDSETHYYLGQYLRLVRDIHNIDLMQYYNCWDGSLSNKLRIKKDNEKYYIDEDNEIQDGKKVLLVPVKFNQQYTIYANCSGEVKITYAYWDGTRIINNIDSGKENVPTPLIKHNLTYINPLVIDKYTKSGDDFTILSPAGVLLEDYLVMIIEMPKSSISSVVVLEGNYSDNKLILNNNSIDLVKVNFGKPSYELTNDEYNLSFKSPSSLTTNIANDVYAFNDRLIEYLTWNTITPQDNINENIVRVQNYITTDNFLKQNGVRYNKNQIEGTYDRDLRTFIYNTTYNNIKNKYYIDINGFVDKDAEEVILRGK